MSQDLCTCELRPKGRPVYTDFRQGGSLVFGLELVKCPFCKTAPDVIEAAKLLLETLDMLTPHEYMRGKANAAYDRLKAAVAKAEGR